MKKILVTGGSGRFGSVLKKFKTNHKMIFPSKKELNILDLNSIKSYLKKKKPNILIHLAGLSRPMEEHEKNIQKSIDLNIIGTANIVKGCADNKIKLIYFSTNYVYPGKKGNYSETDPLNPVNNYAWSKLGGEASVRLFKNSLILRTCMTEKPFIHKKAFKNVKTNFIFHEKIIPILFKILNKKGIINLGGKRQSVYDFARETNPKVKKIYLNDFTKRIVPKDSSMNLKKLKNILKRFGQGKNE
tara:strand:+ start:65 stop:796 length:732 start_codon:yes stop_codon:yes gene_type:complete